MFLKSRCPAFNKHCAVCRFRGHFRIYCNRMHQIESNQYIKKQLLHIGDSACAEQKQKDILVSFGINDILVNSIESNYVNDVRPHLVVQIHMFLRPECWNSVALASIVSFSSLTYYTFYLNSDGVVTQATNEYCVLRRIYRLFPIIPLSKERTKVESARMHPLVKLYFSYLVHIVFSEIVK